MSVKRDGDGRQPDKTVNRTARRAVIVLLAALCACAVFGAALLFRAKQQAASAEKAAEAGEAAEQAASKQAAAETASALAAGESAGSGRLSPSGAGSLDSSAAVSGSYAASDVMGGKPAEKTNLLNGKFTKEVEEHSDYIGQITIPDTVIDYPVFFRTLDNDFYLHHDMDGNDSAAGTIFLDGYGSPDPDSLCDDEVLYGHHMKDGSMFASITKFQDQAYYEKHKTIQYDTIYGDGRYKIFAAFSLDVGHITDLVRILYFSPNKNKTDFDYFVKMMQENSLIDTGLTPEYGDRLLTLSTCEYTHSAGNGRFVVLAYKE